MMFEIVLPNEESARLIMEWRNDPLTLAMSYSGKAKIWDSFYPEFLNYAFALPDLPPLFIIADGKRAGFMRFSLVEHPDDPARRCCEVSINIAPEFRGKGIGKKALLAVQPWVKRQGYDSMYAEVKKENKASHALFKGAGFSALWTSKNVATDTGETVVAWRYLLELTGPQKTAPVFIIAEAGSNWRMGSMPRDRAMARALISAAKEAGADAVKFQTYRSETVYVRNAGKSSYLEEFGITEEITNIFDDLAMPYELIEELAVYCKECGIEFMTTPFSERDFKAVDPWVARHKIASYEIGHSHLLELAARSKKPLFLSTGAATEQEISWAVEFYRSKGGQDLTLMQCTAKYPAPSEAMNLRTIPWLYRRFSAKVGLSDHSRDPILAPVSAVALGAAAIEKHFTLSNDLPGPDHRFAIVPGELKRMVSAVREAEKMRGSEYKQVHECENELRDFAKRGVQALHNIEKGELLHEGRNVGILRPGNQKLGLHPKFLEQMEGRPAAHFIKGGSGIQFGDWERE